MEYKEVVKIEGYTDSQRFGIRVDLLCDRDITVEESRHIEKACSDFLDLLRRNTELMDPKEIVNRLKERNQLLNCFGSELIYVEDIPNEYSPFNVNPWFIVSTRKGRIKIGWRKRVINIDWSESDIRHLGRDIFKGENVTGAHYYEMTEYIHADGYEKATEYINKLLNS